MTVATFFYVTMGLREIFRRKSIQMSGAVTHVERDSNGNIWYLSDMFGKRLRWKASYDLTSPLGKSEALTACTPLYTVIDKLGSMMSRGVIYVTDKNGNEKPRYREINELLLSPNPLQSFTSFVKQVEMNLRLFGFCPIALVRGIPGGLPSAMWVIQPELFHLEGTGSFAKQNDLEGVVGKAYIQWGGRRTILEPWEYVVVHIGDMAMPEYAGRDIIFKTSTDSLSQPVSNWVSAMSASHTLMVNGGPKGILCGVGTDEMGNTAIDPKDEDEIRDKFKRKYGLVGKEYPVLVTRKQLKWIPMDFDADKLKLHEEDSRCTAAIANAIGLNPNLFNDAKYDNQESAKKAAYQDVVIPDAMNIADSLTRSICQEGAKIKIDFSGVECLQANKEKEANTLLHAADALERLMASGLITPDEARIEIARYIDIDPESPVGEFRKSTPSVNGDKTAEEGGNDEQV